MEELQSDNIEDVQTAARLATSAIQAAASVVRHVYPNLSPALQASSFELAESLLQTSRESLVQDAAATYFSSIVAVKPLKMDIQIQQSVLLKKQWHSLIYIS